MIKFVLYLLLVWISIRQGRGSPIATTCRAEDGFFRCLISGRCLPRHRVRSYDTECHLGSVTDNSDEDTEPLNCTDDEFRCRFIHKCVPRYLLNTDESCKLNEGLVLPCRNQTEFTCKRSKLCIPRWMVRNGKRDCDTMVVKDGSDENMSLASCDASEFPCSGNTTSPLQCVPRVWVTDGVEDCKNGKDELFRLTSCRNDTESRCNANGRCLERHRVMNDFPDCPDASDEKQALECIPDKEFRCRDNGRCIPRSWRGNMFTNCKDGSDEDPWGKNETCVNGEFRCRNGKRCIPTYLLCDGMDHCGDCSDEIESCVEPRMLRCPNEPGTCVLPTYSCDEFADCPGNAEDVKDVTGFKCNKVVAGLDNRIEYCVLPQWTLTDEYPICQDSSDLCFVNGTFTCHRCLYSDIIISPKQVCDGIFDCPDLTDECLCARNVPASSSSIYLCDNVCYGNPGSTACLSCTSGQVKCGLEEVCISKSQVCDGKVDCPITKLDELHCGRSTNQSYVNNSMDFQCDIIPQKIKTFAYNFLSKDIVSSLAPLQATRCNNVVECGRFEDECSERANCSSRLPVCDQIPMITLHVSRFLVGGKAFSAPLRQCQIPQGRRIILGSSICNGLDECIKGYDEMNCPNRFQCAAGKVETVVYGFRDRVSIPVGKTCNLVSDCANSTDELNCPDLTHFYCLNKNPPFVPRTKVLDGVSDCSDSSDECPPNYLQNDALASNEQMIKIRALEILVWFMAVLALLGNLAVMVKTVLYLKQIKIDQLQTKVGLINNAMIFNLALADFLMGVVLLVIGIKAVEFSGNYCLFDKIWRSSNLCNAIGALTVVSSETSVLTLVCITTYRLYCIYEPFESRHVRGRIAVLWICIIWLISFLIAFLPFSTALSGMMLTSAQIKPSPYFHTDQVKLSDVRQFALRIAALSNKTHPKVTSYNWNSLHDYFMSEQSSVAPSTVAYFGYYSSSSVCIPRLFRISKDESSVNPMSSVVITFNFVALLFIALSYCAIYFRSSGGGIAKSSAAKNKQNVSMQRKITVLIATDMCCWLPICIMTFRSMSGAVLSPVSYAVSAIVLLPINSSLNPMIYTNFPRIIYSNIQDLINKGRNKFRSPRSSDSADQPRVIEEPNKRVTRV